MIALMVESAVRAVAFAGVIGLVLQVARVKNVATRLAAWTSVLYGALLLPVAVPFLPALPVPVLHRTVSPKLVVLSAIEASAISGVSHGAPKSRFDWKSAGEAFYLVIAAGLLGRLGFGLLVSRRLRRTTRPVTDSLALALLDVHTRTAGISQAPELVESNGLAVPITVGWLRPSIILPDNWREWDEAKLAAVLAHELSHVRRGDYGTLFLSSLYRCIFWFSPLSWWLDRQLRELAEQASDDSALDGAVDRAQYAEVLLSFFEALQGERGRARWQGVAMARGRRAENRIDRILASNRILSTPARWPVMAGLTLVCVPLLYLSGALQPVMAQSVPPPPPPPAPVAEVASPEPPEPLPPPPPPPQWSHDKGLEGYVIVTGDTTTMSGSTDDLRRAKAMHGRIGGDYIWFRRDGKAFVIRDAGMLKAAAKLLEPQHELGMQQGELGDQQAKLGELQAELGEKQSRVRTTPADLTREIDKLKEKLRKAGSADELGDVQALLAELQSKIGDKQSHIGDQQAKLGEEQAKLGERQAELGEKQAKLGEEQAKHAEEASRQLRKLFDDAFKKGLVEPEPR